MKHYPLLLFAFFFSVFTCTCLFFAFDPDDFVALDSLAASLVHPLQTLGFVELFLTVTVFGSVTAAALGLLFLVAVVRPPHLLSARLASAVALCALLVTLGKAFFERVRPSGIIYVAASPGYSFPSWHAAGVAVLFGFFLLLAHRKIASRLVRISVESLCIFTLVVVPFSRIVLGYHYASDVIAGFSAGLACLAFVFLYPLTEKERLYLRRTRQ